MNIYKSKALLIVLLFSMCVSPIAKAAFSDISASHSNYDAINYVQSQNIVDGYSDGTYKPESTINRAEFTKIIIESKYPGEAFGNGCFSDVHEEWFAPYVCTAKGLGIIGGYPDGTFKPGQNIAFSEAAKIIINTFGYNVESDDIWYKPFVEKLGEQNAIPVSISDFGKNITRGEMAEMVYRLHATVTSKPSNTYLSISNPSVLKTPAETAFDLYLNPNMKSLDDIWIQYTNTELGISIKIPKTVDNTKCANERVSTRIPMTVFDDDDEAIYITQEYSYDWSSCEKKTHSLATQQNSQFHGWKLMPVEVNNETELNVVIQNTYDDSCQAGTMTEVSSGLFDVKLEATPENAGCSANYGQPVVKYSPNHKKVVEWNLGQDINWYIDNGTTVYDDEMIESFRFE